MENNQVLTQGENTIPNIHSEQIKEEFYKWFESRGLLAELRAYMRQLMVRALEENNASGKNKWQQKSFTSPKLQAINLLVVDYLFHEEFFYTVSVFASEAHILESLPQYSSYVTQSVQQRRWDPDSLPRFSRQETEDILDTLHLPSTPQLVRQAVDCYLTGRDSLLACIVRVMVPACGQSSDNVREEEDNCSQCDAEAQQGCHQQNYHQQNYHQQGCHQQGCHQLWSQEMQQLLLMAGLKLTHILRMQHKWAQIIENERQEARREAEEGFAAREVEWQRVMEERLQEERADLRERQSRVEIREQGLASLAEHLTQVHEDVTQRLSQLQLQSDQLDERAYQQEIERQQLQTQTEELKTRERNLVTSSKNESDMKPLQRVNESLEGHQAYHQNIKSNEAFVQAVSEEDIGVTISTQTLNEGTAASTQTLDVAVVASTQTVDTVDHELQTSLDLPDPEIVAQLEQARRKISELQEENLELRAHILQQRHRIDELTNRAANLSSQLQESQVAVAVLSGRESGVLASAPSPPPPPPVPIAPTFGFRAPQRQGGGEESLFVPRPQQTTPRADGRRRPLRFAFSQQPSPTSGESSPTDEVIQNARARIQQLEQESVSIQRNFQDFQSRLFTADSLMFPPLRTSRISDPILRVRRNEAHSFPTSRINHPPAPFDNLNRLIQNRQLYEEHEESSSEFYDSYRIESISNSRRLFNQRNIRHYERWKQFKKKFQKRDGSDYTKRHFKAVNSNTSSEDDDVNVRNLRRQDTNQSKRNNNTQIVNNQDQQANSVLVENELGPELRAANICVDNEPGNRDAIPKFKSGKAEESHIPKNLSSNMSTEKITCTKEETPIVCLNGKESQIGIDLVRSAKLIESVKVLLEAQSIKESGATSLSNGSLAVESLPRDSLDNSQVDVGKTDSSFVTVQKVNQNKDIEIPNASQKNINPLQQNITSNPPNQNSFNNHESHSNFVIQGTEPINQSQKQSDDRKASCNTEKFSATTLGSNLESEELVSNFAVTSSDVAEVESGDRATTSLTSGSDILRELNPSKTNSSSSEMSAGFGEDSKHSSDFWD